MSWVMDDNSGCEGFAAYVLRDGRDAEGATCYGLVVGWDEDARKPVTVPFSELLGFEAACTCGWRGSLWRVRAGEEWPDDIEVRDGVTAEDDIRSQWLGHVGRLARYD